MKAEEMLRQHLSQPVEAQAARARYWLRQLGGRVATSSNPWRARGPGRFPTRGSRGSRGPR